VVSGSAGRLDALSGDPNTNSSERRTTAALTVRIATSDLPYGQKVDAADARLVACGSVLHRRLTEATHEGILLESPMSESLTLTAVFTPDENGWTMAQLAEWPAVVTCGRTVEEAREMLLDAAREMIASYRDEGREPPIGGGHAEKLTIDLAAA
jgi:predicted RNase H-like HicB family nuclease